MEQAVNIWRWTAGGQPQAWGKLVRDPEIWDPDGEALAYFGPKFPAAAFRVPASTLINSGSKVLQDMLVSSRRLPTKGRSAGADFSKIIDSNLLVQTLPDTVSVNGTDAGFTPSPSIKTAFSGDTLSDSSSIISSRPSFAIVGSNVSDANDSKSVKKSKDGNIKSTSIWRLPGSRSTSGSVCLSNPTIGDLDNKKMEDNTGVLYDLYFTAPPKLTAAAAIRYHLTTRNVLAFLLNRSLVGLNFCQALRDLKCRLEAYMPPQTNCVKLIVRYLVRKQLHNVSNNPSTAAGLLAWSEDAGVHWLEGWREAFVHCCGMYTRLAETPEFGCISEVSKGLLESAYTELQSRMRLAEKRLLTFNFDNIWLPLTISNSTSNATAATNVTSTASSENSADGSGIKSKNKICEQQQQQQARAAFDSFRQFLTRYYEKAYKSWRIRVAQEHCNDSWLTRKLVRELQADFGALYEYLVDRDAVWGSGGDIIKNIPAGRGQRADFVIASPATASNGNINSDIVAQMIRLLRHYDYRHSHTPLLCPFPLLPASVPIEAIDEQDGQQSAPRRGLHALMMGKSTRARDKRVVAAYAAVNNNHFYSNMKPHAGTSPNPMINPLVEAFRKHEKSEQPRHLDPRSARVGRWIMLYSVLQVLAEISVDTPHLFFNDVPYFLNPRLSNTPPWKMENDKRQPVIGKMVVGIFDEASRLYSYCWNAPKRWTVNGQNNDENQRFEGTLNSFPVEMVDPRDIVPSVSTLSETTMHAHKKDSFAVSSPRKASIRSVSVSEDTSLQMNEGMKNVGDVDASGNKSLRVNGHIDVNAMNTDKVNIVLNDNDRTPTSVCSPLVKNSMSSSRSEHQANYCRSPHGVDNVSEERDEDFSYFNNVSHERQGMPGFRAPLKTAIARSRSRSFLRADATASTEAQASQTSQAAGICENSSNGLESQSISPRNHDTASKREVIAAAAPVPLKPTNVADNKGNDVDINQGTKLGIGESRTSDPMSRPVLGARSRTHAGVIGAGTCADISNSQGSIHTKAGLLTGVGVVGRSDYAAPVEW